jgi:hypothetical protein
MIWGGGMVIHVKSEHFVDHYCGLPMLESANGWRKMCFFLRNGVVVLLPMFTGNLPIPQPNWGYGVAKDLHKLQPLRMVFQ